MQIKTMFISLYTWPQRTGSNLNVKKIGEKTKKKKKHGKCYFKIYMFVYYLFLYVYLKRG